MADPFDLLTGDGLIANSFGCEIEGTPLVVKDVSGLKQEFDMIEVKSQTAKGVYQIRKIPGRQKPVSVTITRQLTDDMYFSDWMQLIDKGQTVRRDVVVSVYDPAAPGTAVKRYTVKNAQPSSCEVTQVQAGGTNVLDEKITLQGERLVVEKG